MLGQQLSNHFPPLTWGKSYSREKALGDLTAACIVTLILIPQALAYAMLSGLPPHAGLYASMLPLIGYALLGTSSALAVGPVAIAALMTASAIAPYSALNPALGIAAAVVLATMSGVILFSAGLLKAGFLANFLSYPVITGFLSAASIVIAMSQLPTLLGLTVNGNNLVDITTAILDRVHQIHTPTVLLSVLSIFILIGSRQYLWRWLLKQGCSRFWSQACVRVIPVIIILLGTWGVRSGVAIFDGVKTVGLIHGGLPPIQLPSLDTSLWQSLWIPALFITIIGYVESVAVAQSLAIRFRERIDPNQEMIALGIANICAGISSALPVAGGVSRSAVNADAGAATPAAGLFTALCIIISTGLIAPWLGALPRFILAATIIVAILWLIDWSAFRKTWNFSRRDFIALLITFCLTLLVSVEWGISAGVILSIGMHLYRSSQPHSAIVGQVAGTEHFRNIARHEVVVCKSVVTLRIDESLFFANTSFLEKRILDILADYREIQHLVLMCSAVNDIDISALQTLETINCQLREIGIGFHLSEVKGPVMDQLKRTHFLERLNGQVYLTQFQAYERLSCFDRENAIV